jgi:hypothetical protein
VIFFLLLLLLCERRGVRQVFCFQHGGVARDSINESIRYDTAGSGGSRGSRGSRRGTGSTRRSVKGKKERKSEE